MNKLSYEIYVVTKTGHMFETSRDIKELTEALRVLRQTTASINNGYLPDVVRAELVVVTRTILS